MPRRATTLAALALTALIVAVAAAPATGRSVIPVPFDDDEHAELEPRPRVGERWGHALEGVVWAMPIRWIAPIGRSGIYFEHWVTSCSNRSRTDIDMLYARGWTTTAWINDVCGQTTGWHATSAAYEGPRTWGGCPVTLAFCEALNDAASGVPHDCARYARAADAA